MFRVAAVAEEYRPGRPRPVGRFAIAHHAMNGERGRLGDANRDRARFEHTLPLTWIAAEADREMLLDSDGIDARCRFDPMADSAG